MPAPATRASAETTTPTLLLIVAGLLAMQPFATDLYLPSLPAISEAFGAPVTASQLTLSIFIAGFGLAQGIVGPLSDRFGRRPVALAGCLLYASAAAAGALANSLTALIGARAVQSVGACAVVVCARAIVRDRHSPEGAAYAMSHALGWMALAPILGTWLGGALQSAFGWRANFVAMSLIGLAMLVVTLKTLRETNLHLNPTATEPVTLLRTYARIAQHADFRAFAVIATGSYCAIFSFLSGSSFVAQRVLGLSAHHYGLFFGSVTIGFFVGTRLARRLVASRGLGGTIRIGAVVGASAGLSLLGLTLTGVVNLYTIGLSMFLVLVMHGMLQPTAQMGAIGPFPRQAGAATALAGIVMHTAAMGVGLLLGALFDNSAVPLAALVAAITSTIAVAAFSLAPLTRQAPAS